jgi:hypothetical protein
MVLKCLYCKIRKISSIFSYSCKCGLKNLCQYCKMPEDHKCTFDFINEGRTQLEKANPIVISDKLNKI